MNKQALGVQKYFILFLAFPKPAPHLWVMKLSAPQLSALNALYHEKNITICPGKYPQTILKSTIEVLRKHGLCKLVESTTYTFTYEITESGLNHYHNLLQS